MTENTTFCLEKKDLCSANVETLIHLMKYFLFVFFICLFPAT